MGNRKKQFEEEVYSANIAKSSPHRGHREKVKEKKKDKRRKRFGRLLVVIQMFLTCFFAWMLFDISVIPMKYLLPVVIALFLLLWICHFSQKKSNFGSFLGKCVSLIVIVALGIGSFSLRLIDTAFDTMTDEVVEDSEAASVSLTDKTFYVYISGNDVFDSMEKNNRSDVNIIATVNPKTGQALLTTTPRDAYVVIPGVSEGQKDKLTHAGIYGVEASMAALEHVYEKNIPLYVRVNFNFIVDIVDELGGIDVNSKYAFTTKDGYEVKEGMNHFNGKEALSFCRERKAVPGGDNQRGKNQQAVIVALAKKILSPQMLLKAGSILNSVSDSVDTNISRSQMQAFILMQLSEGREWSIYSTAASGIDTKEYTYSMPSKRLYVTKLSEESITEIMDLMNRVENGEKIKDSENVN